MAFFAKDKDLPFFEIVGFERSSVRTIGAAKRIVEAVNEPNLGYVIDAYNLYLHQQNNLANANLCSFSTKG